MEEVDVPSYFLCPISLEMMKDPVTLSTGITYDRESIEKWISSSSSKNLTCPITKQPISSDCDLMMTPNHTLRRLIQSWCTLNASYGIQRIPTPKPPVTRVQLAKLMETATSSSSESRLNCLRRLKSIASHSEANKRCMEASGAVDFLSSIIIEDPAMNSNEALTLMYTLQVSEPKLKTLITAEFVGSLLRIMQCGTYESRAYAILMLESVFEFAESAQIASLANTKRRLFFEVVEALKDRTSQKATKAALKLLAQLCPPGRNRVKAVEAGAVRVLIELLLETDSSDKKRVSEIALTVLDMCCQCAEGRAEILSHAAGIAVVSKKILRVSQVASEKAVRILLSVSKFSGTARVLEEMLQLGVAAKMCLVLQVDCGGKTKEKAAEILKMNARTWKNSPCIPSTLASSYP